MIHGVAVTPFDAAAILIALAALLGYINRRFLDLPPSIGLTVMGASASLLMIGLDRLLPGGHLARDMARFLDGIDFHKMLMDGMLSFLLFAGALHVDRRAMRRGRSAVIVLSTVGVLLSTVLIGVGFHLLTGAVSHPVPLLWSLVFGALISPTDPVAVLGVLKRTEVTPTLAATVAGESLFNDGVGVVVFTILLAAAARTDPFSVGHASLLFVRQAGGGGLFGLLIGWVAVRGMSRIDDRTVEVTITLAVVMGGYAVASLIGVSGPVAMAAAGLLIGGHGAAHATSGPTRDHLLTFWSVIDDLLNAALFLLIGLEVVAIPSGVPLLIVGAAAIPLVLLARTLSVLGALVAVRPFLSLGRSAPVTLIWGGLRGGIALALALGLPHSAARDPALTATYVVVLFSVIVQGGTMERMLARTRRGPAKAG